MSKGRGSGRSTDRSESGADVAAAGLGLADPSPHQAAPLTARRSRVQMLAPLLLAAVVAGLMYSWNGGGVRGGGAPHRGRPQTPAQPRHNSDQVASNTPPGPALAPHPGPVGVSVTVAGNVDPYTPPVQQPDGELTDQLPLQAPPPWR